MGYFTQQKGQALLIFEVRVDQGIQQRTEKRFEIGVGMINQGAAYCAVYVSQVAFVKSDVDGVLVREMLVYRSHAYTGDWCDSICIYSIETFPLKYPQDRRKDGLYRMPRPLRGASPRIAITSATGNIGSKIVEFLTKSGCKSRLIVRDATKAQARFGDEAEIVYGDFSNVEGTLFSGRTRSKGMGLYVPVQAPVRLRSFTPRTSRR